MCVIFKVFCARLLFEMFEFFSGFRRSSVDSCTDFNNEKGVLQARLARSLVRIRNLRYINLIKRRMTSQKFSSRRHERTMRIGLRINLDNGDGAVNFAPQHKSLQFRPIFFSTFFLDSNSMSSLSYGRITRNGNHHKSDANGTIK